MLLALAVLLLLFLVLLLLLLVARVYTRKPVPPIPPEPPPIPPGPPPAPGRIPNQFDPSGLAKTLSLRLAGTPADGSRATPSAGDAMGPVIWVDHGDEVLVHLESMEVQMLDGIMLVSVDLESDQTGRTPLIVSIAFGKSDDGAGLLGVTDEYPRGNGVLAARWGAVLQEAVWASLLGLAKDHAMQSGQAPRAISITAGKLVLQPGRPLEASPS